ncbi:MAG: T9SS type A sorting domain-containing protein [Bacteroidales bacterium]|nr:T9SS type A sorting domain-containing protein [Bacteroidales bacterium]
MKTIYTFLFCVLVGTTMGQYRFADPYSSVFENITKLSNHETFYKSSFFKLAAENIQLMEARQEIVADASYLILDFLQIDKILSTKPALLYFEIPTSDGKTHILKLARYQVTTNNYKANTGNYNDPETFVPPSGLFYRGVVDESENEWASISIFSHGITGIVARDNGNWVLAALKGDPFVVPYIFYNDKDLSIEYRINCEMNHDFGEVYQENDDKYDNLKSASELCPIDVFWVADYEFYTTSNFDINMANSNLQAIFNNVATLYQIEGIVLNLSETFVHTTQDFYTKTDTWIALQEFCTNIHQASNFDEDLALLIAVASNGYKGGYAIIDALCSDFIPGQPTHAGRCAYCRIEPYFQDVPLYSYTILVSTHEMGHNVGSRHTHWCGWPVGALDNCAAVEPDPYGNMCYPGPYPSDGGTIMSYCETILGSINFVNGFGFYPHNEIIFDVNMAGSCLCSPGSILEDEKVLYSVQVSPNPTSKWLNIDFDLFQPKHYSIWITDIFGKEVISETSDLMIDVSELENGLYLLFVETENAILSEKFIVF